MTHYIQTTKPKWAITAFRGFIASSTHYAYTEKEALDIANKFMKQTKYEKIEMSRR